MLSREHITDALRFWEPARIGYNLVLALITFAIIWPPLLRGTLQFGQVSAPSLIGLAVLANIAYSVVYPIDLLAQATPLRDVRAHWRWTIWGAGTLFAAVLTWLLTGVAVNSILMNW